jgi:hypothetical protein
MAFSEPVKAAISVELNQGDDLVTIARKWGCSLTELRDLKAELQGKPAEGERESMQKYAIARTRAGCPWMKSDRILQAQKDYDAGLIEMATGRVNTEDGPFLILYAIPRKVPDTKRTPYFSRNFNEG